MASRKLLILRRPRSGRLEGRTVPIQLIRDSFTSSKAGIQAASPQRLPSGAEEGVGRARRHGEAKGRRYMSCALTLEVSGIGGGREN